MKYLIPILILLFISCSINKYVSVERKPIPEEKCNPTFEYYFPKDNPEKIGEYLKATVPFLPSTTKESFQNSNTKKEIAKYGCSIGSERIYISLGGSVVLAYYY